MWGNEVVQKFVKVSTVHVIIRCAVVLLQGLPQPRESDAFAGVVPQIRDAFWSDCDVFQMFSQAPPPKQPGGIRSELDACPNFPHHRVGFDDGYAVAGLSEAKCSAQTANAATDHDDVEDEGCLPRPIDGRWSHSNIGSL